MIFYIDHIFGFTGLLSIFIVLMRYVFPVIKFEKPSGENLIGFKKKHFIDKSRLEAHSKKTDDKRELLVQVWYPAVNTINKKPVFYMPQVIEYVFKNTFSGILPIYLFNKFKFHLTNSFEDAPICGESDYPVIVFSHGLGSVCDLNTAIIEELTSHGYIVVGINHTYACYVTHFPDGRIIPISEKFNATISHILKDDEKMNVIEKELQTWVYDTTFILDKLEEMNKKDDFFRGKFDLSRIGMLGHSLSGALAAEICRLDARCKVGVSLDGSVTEQTANNGFDKPFMFIVGVLLDFYSCPMDKRLSFFNIGKHEWSVLINKYKKRVSKLCETIGDNACYDIISGAGHFAFTDISLVPEILKKYIYLDIGFSGNKNVLKSINRKVLLFFDKHLKHKK